MILITGGTGFVGAHLLYKLASEGQSIRVIYRNEKKFSNVKRIFSYYTENIEALFNSIEWCKADLNDIPSLTEAFKDIKYVYHCAAFVSFEPNKFDLLQKTNIEGTANIVNLCVSENIKKLCYMSSVAAIGEPKKGENITEETEWNSELDNSVYAITKYGAELEVWRGAQEGLDTVIVNPSVILGSGIWKYGSGSIIKTVHRGLSHFTSGSMGYVAVEDVVKSMTVLMNSNIKNERFIINAENWRYKEFLAYCAKSLNVKPPKKEAKRWLLQLGWRLDWLTHKLTGKRRKLTKQLAETLITESSYKNTKLKEALDFKFTPISDSITSACKQYLKDIT